MTNRYEVGQGVTLVGTFDKLTDAFAETYALYNPTTPTLVVKHPSGTKDTYTYPASAQITKPANTTGMYEATIVPNAVGEWDYEWIDPDATTPGHNKKKWFTVEDRGIP